MQVNKNQKTFSDFFSAFFWNLDQILNILKNKMNLKAYVFPKLRTAQDVLR